MNLMPLVSESLQLLWPARCAGCDQTVPEEGAFNLYTLGVATGRCLVRRLGSIMIINDTRCGGPRPSEHHA